MTWGPDGVALTEDDIVNGCVMGPHGSSACIEEFGMAGC